MDSLIVLYMDMDYFLQKNLKLEKIINQKLNKINNNQFKLFPEKVY